MNSGCAAALDGLQDFCFMAAKAANREPCPPPLPTLDFAPAFEVYTELGIDPCLHPDAFTYTDSLLLHLAVVTGWNIFC